MYNHFKNEKSNKEFLYAIADDSNLVLTDCAFEFCNFETEEAVASNIFLRLEKIYQDNLMQTIINTHFFNIIFGANSIFTNVYNQVQTQLTNKAKINETEQEEGIRVAIESYNLYDSVVKASEDFIEIIKSNLKEE